MGNASGTPHRSGTAASREGMSFVWPSGRWSPPTSSVRRQGSLASEHGPVEAMQNVAVAGLARSAWSGVGRAHNVDVSRFKRGHQPRSAVGGGQRGQLMGSWDSSSAGIQDHLCVGRLVSGRARCRRVDLAHGAPAGAAPGCRHGRSGSAGREDSRHPGDRRRRRGDRRGSTVAPRTS